MLRLAAQVQARTQQLTTRCGQGKQLLVRTHGLNLAARCGQRQAAPRIRLESAMRLRVFLHCWRAKKLSPVPGRIAKHQKMRIQ
jgi:hypothetical protein